MALLLTSTDFFQYISKESFVNRCLLCPFCHFYYLTISNKDHLDIKKSKQSNHLSEKTKDKQMAFSIGFDLLISFTKNFLEVILKKNTFKRKVVSEKTFFELLCADYQKPVVCLKTKIIEMQIIDKLKSC